MTDLISRADAMGAVQDHFNANGFKGYDDGQKMMDRIKALPSAEAVDAEKLKDMKFVTIKGDKVEEAYRTGWNGAIDCVIGEYASADAVSRVDGTNASDSLDEEVVSADAVQGEWVRKVKEYNDCDGHRFVYWYECDQCGARPPKDTWKNEWHSNYCPSCGARMKGGAK